MHGTHRSSTIVAYRMTKPETDFAEEDLGMARRALWLLEGHPPGAEQPPLDFGFMRLHSHTGSDGFALPLAHFALNRYLDSTRAAPPVAWIETMDEPNPQIADGLLLRKAQSEASQAEKKANEQLREGRLRVSNAVELWLGASEKRADEYARIPAEHLTGDHHAVLAELLAAGRAVEKALELMDRSMRRVAPPDTRAPFPSTLGLPKAVRNELLNAQALRLAEAGHSLEEVAYVMGWYVGTPEYVRDRTRKRLQEARAREARPPEML